MSNLWLAWRDVICMQVEDVILQMHYSFMARTPRDGLVFFHTLILPCYPPGLFETFANRTRDWLHPCKPSSLTPRVQRISPMCFVWERGDFVLTDSSTCMIKTFPRTIQSLLIKAHLQVVKIGSSILDTQFGLAEKSWSKPDVVVIEDNDNFLRRHRCEIDVSISHNHFGSMIVLPDHDCTETAGVWGLSPTSDRLTHKSQNEQVAHLRIVHLFHQQRHGLWFWTFMNQACSYPSLERLCQSYHCDSVLSLDRLCQSWKVIPTDTSKCMPKLQFIRSRIQSVERWWPVIQRVESDAAQSEETWTTMLSVAAIRSFSFSMRRHESRWQKPWSLPSPRQADLEYKWSWWLPFKPSSFGAGEKTAQCRFKPNRTEVFQWSTDIWQSNQDL